MHEVICRKESVSRDAQKSECKKGCAAMSARGKVRKSDCKKGCAERRHSVSDLTRSVCPQGTARIQLRCRAKSATVPSSWLVSFGVRDLFRLGSRIRVKNAGTKSPHRIPKWHRHESGISKKGPPNDQNAIKIHTRRQRWAQNRPDGVGNLF